MIEKIFNCEKPDCFHKLELSLIREQLKDAREINSIQELALWDRFNTIMEQEKIIQKLSRPWYVKLSDFFTGGK